MKIWILCSELPTTPFPGGIARYVDNFARAAGAQGHEVLVIVRGEEETCQVVAPGYRCLTFASAYARLGAEAPSARPDEHAAYPYNLLDYWTAHAFEVAGVVERVAREEGAPDVIEAQEYAAVAYYVQQRQLTDAGYLPGVPTVIHLHSPGDILRRVNQEPRYRLPQYWWSRLELATLRAADAIVSPSHFLAGQVQREMLDDDGTPVTVVPYPHMPELPEVTGPGEEHRVVMVGRLEVRKGVLELLRASEELWREGEPLTVHLVGGETRFFPRGEGMESYLRRTYAQRLTEGRLHLYGHCAYPEAQEQVRRAAIAAVPSRWDNFPNTCMEAMALGKAVLASRQGGQAEMLGTEPACGLLFDVGEAGACAEQLRRALAMTAEERSALGARARARLAEMCDPVRVVEQRVAHFQEVLDRRRPRTHFPFVNKEAREGTANAGIVPLAGEKGGVTVVIPYYNMGRYIDETLASALASTYERLEVVIVDDGSTERESIRKLEEIEAREPARVRVHRQENRGLAEARNAGAAVAGGEYVAFLDADDQYETAFVECAVAVLERYVNVHLVFCWERYFDRSEDIFPGWNLELPYLLAHNLTAPLVVARRDAFLTYGKNRASYQYNFEDYDAWLSMVEAGCGGVCLAQILVRYRIRSDGLWQGSNRDQHLHLYERLAEHHAQLYRRYGVELFQLQNANGPAEAWLKPAADSPYEIRLRWYEKQLERLRGRVRELESR